MKSIFTVLVFIISISVSAQSYHKLLNSDYYWDIVERPMGGFCYGSNHPFRYMLDGDTVINSIPYAKFKKFMMSSTTTFNIQCPPFYVETVSTPVTHFFLREDTINKKVYKYRPDISQEMLLFDFSAQQGDSIDYGFLGYFKVDTVFYMTTSDNKQRKVLRCGGEFDYVFPNGLMIEGIGGCSGIFVEPFYPFEGGMEVLCVKDIQYNVQLYGSDICTDLITDVSSADSKPEVIFNPGNRTLTVFREGSFTLKL